MKFFIFLALSAISISLVESKAKHWLVSCQFTGCYLSFNFCLNCYGEKNCIKCIENIHIPCSDCAQSIFNEDYLEILDGTKYLICDPNEHFQNQVCHLYCRGKYFTEGYCQKLNNVPVCQCLPNSLTTQLPLTTEIPSASFDGTIKLRVSVSFGFQKIFILPNGDLVRGSSSNAIDIWDLNNGTIKKTLISEYTNPNVFGLLSNGLLVAGYSKNKTLLIWDIHLEQDNALKQVIQTDDSIQFMTVLNNDQLAIAPNQFPYDIVIRSSQDGVEKKRLVGHVGIVYQIIELPNGNLLSCSYDKSVKEWNVANGSVFKSLIFSKHVSSMALLKNGHLAVGLFDGTISIWNLESVNLVNNLIGHTDKFCFYDCLQVLDNGDLLSVSYDRSLKVWDPNNGTVKIDNRLLIHQMSILPSGNLIGSSSIEILVWN